MARFSDETIHIENLSVSGIIGVYPEERARPQPLVVDLSLSWDFARAAETDDVRHTADYAEVARDIRAFVEAHPFHLLETLARRMAQHLGERYGSARLSLRIRKPEAIADADAASVSLTLSGPAGPKRPARGAKPRR
jgi:dihydroneopterin aldolase